MYTEILEVEINKVVPYPMILKMYKPKNLKGLEYTMKFAGLLEPLKGVRKGDMVQIFDGLSRLKVAIELGWEKITVELFDDLTEEQIQDQSVLRNYKTKRSMTEIINQAELILGILGSSQGKKRERIGDLTTEDQDFCLAGKDRFELACEIMGCDFSATTLRRLFYIKEFEESGDDEVKGLAILEKIEKEGLKVNTAFNMIDRYNKEKLEQGTNALTETLAYVKGKNFKLFNQSCDNLDDIPDNSIQCAIDSPPYFDQIIYPNGENMTNKDQHGLEKSVDEFIKREVDIRRKIYLKLKDTGSLFITIADTSRDGVSCLVIEKLILGMVNSGWFLIQKWIWKKENSKPNSIENRLLPSYEYILHFAKDSKKYYFRDFKNWKVGGSFHSVKGSHDAGKGKKMKNNTWTLTKPFERFKNFLDEQDVENVIKANGFIWAELKDIDPKFRHLAPYPSYIPLLPILMTTKPGDTVLDVFSGTATSSAVAIQLGRVAIGYDTDPESHKFAVKRLTMVEENLPTPEELSDFEDDYMVAA